MPPKTSKPAGPSKKTVEKKKEKVIEDKTFGLKNKKGAKQQRFIDQVQKQVKSGGPNPIKPADVNSKKLEKEKKLKEQLEINMLFRPVATQKVPKGTDPKSVLCAFFKQGQCTKGDRCKFSHDLAIERKAEKRSLYCDIRDDEGDTMENWDEAKLKEVVQQKHGDTESKRATTDIICKFFLEAVENSKYGWFWSCPNGSSCIYKHALPPGFVLKKDRKKELDKKDDVSLEDLIERERAALGSNFTKVTLETFIAWKKRKLKEKKDLAAKDEEKKRFDYKAGRQMGISGREMFFFNPDLAAADQFEEGDEAFDSYNLDDDQEEQEVKYREIHLDFLQLEAEEVDGTGTQATDSRLNDKVDHSTTNGNASTPESESEGAAAVPINENLFVDDDLDDLDDEFDDLDLDH